MISLAMMDSFSSTPALFKMAGPGCSRDVKMLPWSPVKLLCHAEEDLREVGAREKASCRRGGC